MVGPSVLADEFTPVIEYRSIKPSPTPPVLNKASPAYQTLAPVPSKSLVTFKYLKSSPD